MAANGGRQIAELKDETPAGIEKLDRALARDNFDLGLTGNVGKFSRIFNNAESSVMRDELLARAERTPAFEVNADALMDADEGGNNNPDLSPFDAHGELQKGVASGMLLSSSPVAIQAFKDYLHYIDQKATNLVLDSDGNILPWVDQFLGTEENQQKSRLTRAIEIYGKDLMVFQIKAAALIILGNTAVITATALLEKGRRDLYQLANGTRDIMVRQDKMVLSPFTVGLDGLAKNLKKFSPADDFYKLATPLYQQGQAVLKQLSVNPNFDPGVIVQLIILANHLAKLPPDSQVHKDNVKVLQEKTDAQQKDTIEYLESLENLRLLFKALENIQNELPDYKTALDTLAQLDADPVFTTQKMHDALFKQRQDEARALLAKQNLSLAEAESFLATLREATKTTNALVELRRTLDTSANEELRNNPAHPIHLYATAAYSEGRNHAIELLQQPQLNAAYHTTFNRTLRNTATVVKNRNNVGNTANAIQELNTDAHAVHGAGGGYGKKFWLAIGQLVAGVIGFVIGILAETAITIKTGGINIAFGGSPFWHAATASGALILTGGATLWSNRQHSYSKAVSNVANAAIKAKAAIEKDKANKAPLPSAPAHADDDPKKPLLAHDSEAQRGSPPAVAAASTTDSSSGSDRDRDTPSPVTPTKRSP